MTKQEKELQAKLEAKAAQKRERMEQFAELIEKYDIYYLADRSRYVRFDHNRGWINFDQTGFSSLFMITTSEEVIWFKEALHLAKRMKSNAVNTFLPCNDLELNTLSTENWLVPAKGEIQPIFNILMNSISGGRQNVKDHIEQCLVYKYLHPEDYKLPCITISGEGGVGKNELVELVFGTIFGMQQVVSVGTKEAFGAFNGQMLGKTVVYIDEAIVEKVEAEALKRNVGNKTVAVNVKYGLQGSFDNTPWYWLGGNGTNGTVLLAGDTTDRRYSVLTVSRNVMYWVGEYLGIEVEGGGKKSLPAEHPCVIWWEKNSKYLSNPEAVAAWLYEIMKKWSGRLERPTALHDEDYMKIVDSQKSVEVTVMETVFDDPTFTHIEKADLYVMYELMNKRDNPRGGVLAAKNFHPKVMNWLAANHPQIALHQKVNIKTNVGATSGAVYAATPKKVVRNTDQYYRYNEDRRVMELFEKVVVESRARWDFDGIVT